MHFFMYFLSLLLVALSTDGLGLPPGWRCDTPLCDARMKEVDDTRVNLTAVSDTTVNDPAKNNTAVITTPSIDGLEGSLRHCDLSCNAKRRLINNPKSTTKRL